MYVKITDFIRCRLKNVCLSVSVDLRNGWTGFSVADSWRYMDLLIPHLDLFMHFVTLDAG